MVALCFWQLVLAHFGGLMWPTLGTLSLRGYCSLLLERSPKGEAEAEPNGNASRDYTLRFFPSVLRKRYDSVPVSMMWA